MGGREDVWLAVPRGQLGHKEWPWEVVLSGGIGLGIVQG